MMKTSGQLIPLQGTSAAFGGSYMNIAHITDDHRIQTIEDHLNGTAERAQRFADAFQAGEYGYCIGKLHDAGKYSKEFQNHILNGGPKVDHSTAGAQAILHTSETGVGLIVAYCAAGHHAGLPDGGSRADSRDEATLFARMKRTVPDYTPFYQAVNLPAILPKSAPPIRMLGKGGFTAAFLIRMLFSCLVDADFLDTETFVSGGTVSRGGMDAIPVLLEKLLKHLAKFGSPTSAINEKRTQILNTCLKKATQPKGLYTLTVPTGGGKTLSSLAFALKHAANHGMNRVIYAIPYTSIIEQNASVFRNILGSQNVLEHHSNFTFPDCKEEQETKEQEKLKLAAENWDAPLIVTTNVQFFESLFANKSSRCRKLHNIANSVIIFDEAQMIPREYLLPCIRAISELVWNYGCTVVLCSATQPALQALFPPEIQCAEICENVPETYQFFRRTTIVQAGEMDDASLAESINAQKQALCIVNTKQHAQNLYALLEPNGAFHLSTMMTPFHRKEKLEQIRERLKNGEPCRVVSTSLIEAGVDVDFPIVYREEAGLDSEIQAAGRCNRENKHSAQESRVIIFSPEEKYRGHLMPSVQLPVDLTRSIARKYTDISSPESIRCYFETMYHVSGEQLDQKRIVEALEQGASNNFSFPFAEVAKKFRLIETDTKPIFIPVWPAAQALLQKLRAGERNRELFREAGLYCVNAYLSQFESLYNAGKVELLDCGLAVLTDPDAYTQETGLALTLENSGTAWFV